MRQFSVSSVTETLYFQLSSESNSWRAVSILPHVVRNAGNGRQNLGNQREMTIESVTGIETTPVGKNKKISFMRGEILLMSNYSGGRISGGQSAFARVQLIDLNIVG